MKKKLYRVHGTVVGGKYLGDYEATSAKKAIEMALQDAEVSLCHQCSDECEDPHVVSAEAEEIEAAK